MFKFESFIAKFSILHKNWKELISTSIIYETKFKQGHVLLVTHTVIIGFDVLLQMGSKEMGGTSSLASAVSSVT